MNKLSMATLAALTTFLTLPAHSQILTVAANCIGYKNKSQTLSVVLDSTTHQLFFYTDDLAVDFDQTVFVSGQIKTPIRFEDKNNPLKVVSQKDQTTAYVLFTSKGSILISNSRGSFPYHCQVYFPQRLGMRYQ